MKHIRQFESYSKKRKLDQVIKESVMIVDDIYKVTVTAEIPQSLLNAYIKKTKDGLDKNARQFYSDTQLAEEITKHVLMSGLDINKLEPSALFGGGPQAQGQAQAQGQPLAPQGQPQVQPQAQPQAQAQPLDAQGQVQVQGDPQAQAQAPVQGQGKPQAQAQAPQGQAQAPQAQAQGQGFEDVSDDEDEEERRRREEEEEDDLPL